MNFGLCVIGCGAFARTFARAIQGELENIDLYFASRDAGRAAAFSAEFHGADSFGSYESAVADSRVNAVYVCTPHHLHLEHARLAAAQGKHILLEKPLARTAEEARNIVALAAPASVQAPGITLMVAENYRFMPPVIAAKDMVERGELGDSAIGPVAGGFPIPTRGMAQ